jgi:hypothetical protein
MSRLRRPLLLLHALVAASALAARAPAEELPTFLDAQTAGPDFHVQGEYAGEVGGPADQRLPLAAQVVALGDGKFEGVLYAGGLPGAGWNGLAPFHFRGQTSGDETRCVGMHGERLQFENSNFEGLIRDGEFRGRADMFRNVVRDASFALKKIRRGSPTLGAAPPERSIVLFNGSHVDEWVDGKIVEDRLLDVGTQTKRQFGDRDFLLHLEFRTPFMPTAAGMKRGNSGVYLKKLWEVQVVDSFGWNGYNRKFERLADFGRCGGIQELVEPRWNMCLPPLSWQTYDIDFEAARFDSSNNLIAPEMVTVRHNGVTVHDRYVLPRVETGFDFTASQTGRPGPITLQQHGNPVRYRNIWAVVD